MSSSKHEFTTDWFSHNKDNFDLALSTIAATSKTPEILEIGSFEGRSAIYMLETLPSCNVTCVDTFQGSMEHSEKEKENLLSRFLKNVQSFIDAKRLSVFVGDSKQVLSEFHVRPDVKKLFDLIYVDGDHTSAGVINDLVRAWEILRPGGILIMDDYLWSIGVEMPDKSKVQLMQQMPFTAINFFLQAYWGKYQVLRMGYQVMIQKLL